MSGASVKIIGMDKLVDTFTRIKAQVTKGVPSALVDGGKIMADAIASEAPKSSGFLASHIDVKVSHKNDKEYSVFVAPNTKMCYPDGADKHAAGKKGFPAFTIAWYIQFGHRLRTAVMGYDSDDYTPKFGKLKKSAKRRGKKKIWRVHGDVAPNPFATRGFAKSIGAVTEKIKAKIGDTIKRVGG